MRTKHAKSEDCENLVRKLVVEKTTNGERITNADIAKHVYQELGVEMKDSVIRTIINDLKIGRAHV